MTGGMSNPKVETNDTEVAESADTGRASKKPKVAVEEEMLMVLKAGYQKHYTEYSRWKKNVTQKLPGKVWKGVYKDYVNSMKAVYEEKGTHFSLDDLPTERTLQDALRCVISKEGTGNSDVDGAEKIEKTGMQSDEDLRQINETGEDDMCRRLKDEDTGPRRNVINFQSNGVGVSSTTSPTSEAKGSEEASEPETPVQNQAWVQTKATEESPEASEPDTSARIQARLATSLEKIAETISENGKHMLQFFQIQVELSSKKLEIAAKEHQKDMVMKELQKLAFLRDNAIISADEFLIKARQVAGTSS